MPACTQCTVHAHLLTAVAAGRQAGRRCDSREWRRGVQDACQSVAWHAQSLKTQPQHGIRNTSESACHLQQRAGASKSAMWYQSFPRSQGLRYENLFVLAYDFNARPDQASCPRLRTLGNHGSSSLGAPAWPVLKSYTVSSGRRLRPGTAACGSGWLRRLL